MICIHVYFVLFLFHLYFYFKSVHLFCTAFFCSSKNIPLNYSLGVFFKNGIENSNCLGRGPSRGGPRDKGLVMEEGWAESDEGDSEEERTECVCQIGRD